MGSGHGPATGDQLHASSGQEEGAAPRVLGSFQGLHRRCYRNVRTTLLFIIYTRAKHFDTSYYLRLAVIRAIQPEGSANRADRFEPEQV